MLAIPGNARADAEAALAARTFPSAAGVAGDLSRTIGHAFTVSAVARLADGTIGRKAEIVRLTANPKEPIWVLGKE